MGQKQDQGARPAGRAAGQAGHTSDSDTTVRSDGSQTNAGQETTKDQAWTGEQQGRPTVTGKESEAEKGVEMGVSPTPDQR